jgi:hypothetical protein
MTTYNDIIKNLKRKTIEILGSLESDEEFVLTDILRKTPNERELVDNAIASPIFNTGKYKTMNTTEKDFAVKRILFRLTQFQIITFDTNFKCWCLRKDWAKELIFI